MSYGCACGIAPGRLEKRCSQGSAWYCSVCDKPIAVCEFFLTPDVHYSEMKRVIMQDGVSRSDSVLLYHGAIGTVRREWSEGESSFLWTNYIRDTVQSSRDLIPFWMKFFSHRSPVDLMDRILITRMLVQVGLCRSTIVDVLCGQDLVDQGVFCTELSPFLSNTQKLNQLNFDILEFLSQDEESYEEYVTQDALSRLEVAWEILRVYRLNYDEFRLSYKLISRLFAIRELTFEEVGITIRMPQI